MTTSQRLSYEEAMLKLLQQEMEITTLKQQVEWFRKYLFGKKSERIVSQVNEEQLTFEGFEVGKPETEETKRVPAHERRKPKREGQDKITLPQICLLSELYSIFPKKRRCVQTQERNL